MLNGLDLFSGYGGITMGLKEWVRPIAYCEIERYSQGILLSRMLDGTLPTAPIWDDVVTFDGRPFKGHVDIIFGGFPCQNISCAGNGEGLGGERSRLFFEIVRIAQECRPKFIFLENVPAIRTRGGEVVGKELARIGYDCRWTVVSAAEIGAPHLRKRWFLLAHSKSEGLARQWDLPLGNETKQPQSPRNAIAGITSDTDSISSIETNPSTKSFKNEWNAWGRHSRQCGKDISSSHWQKVECPVFGMDDGTPFQSHRIKAIGNGVVPDQVKEAFKRLMKLDM